MGLLDLRVIDLSTPNLYPNIIITGDPGSGKTTLAAFAPKPAFLDFEYSTDTVTALIQKGELKTDEVAAYKPKTLEETKNIAELIIRGKKFETIVIDTCTRMQVMQMSEYIAKHKSVEKGYRDKYTVYQADYGFSYRILDEFLLWLCEQPIRIIINTHVKKIYSSTKDNEGNVTRQLISIEPDLTPKLASSAQELFSLIGYLTSKPSGIPGRGAERKLRVNPTSIIVAKNRFHIQQDEIINPTYKGIFPNV